MADKDYSQLTSATTASDSDLLAIYPTGGPLKKLTFATFKELTVAALGGSYLIVTNNLSDLNSASAARANLGLGSVATLASGAVFQVANNFSEVSNAGTARTNIGAAAADAPTITGGMTYTGATKQNVQALSGNAIDVSLGEFFTRSISANATFTFTSATASKAQAFLLELTISSSAVPTWPTSVDWSSGGAPTFPNGKNLVAFVTLNGGTDWTGVVLALNAS